MSHAQRIRASRWRHLLGSFTEAVIAALTLAAAAIGDVDTTTIEAQFSDNVNATDYTAGVTIKVNAVSKAISSGTRQGDHSLVHFVLAAAVDANDLITWEYDDDLGDYADDEANPMGDVAATPGTNYIGAHLYYNTADDSAWLGAT